MSFRFRKFTAVDREHPIIECLSSEVIVFDITKSTDGSWELGIHEGAAGTVLKLATFLDAIDQAKLRFEQDAEGG